MSVKRAQLKKNIKDNSIYFDNADEVDQDKYELFQGVDIDTYSDGDKYVGEFKEGLWHGRGTYTDATGETLIGLWENNEFKGKK